MNQAQKRKKKSAVLAAVLAVTLALTGTFAWQSISQTALNEAKDTFNPGGRLHDDFNGSNKDIYVENFTDKETGTPIYARVRLDEYMETGDGAGEAENNHSTSVYTAASGETTPDRTDVTTWKTHKPGDTADPFHKYVNWTMGGQTVYMPTFNTDKDSLEADRNGTLQGREGDGSKPYSDYIDYSSSSNNSKTVDGVTHTTKSTDTGRVMTMEEWLAEDMPIGAYWVYDEDGWAYWAQPINPGSATGLLLNKIEMTSGIQEDWYYGINAVGQFATKGDWGTPETAEGAGDATGFYKDGITDNAKMLLSRVSGEEPVVTVTMLPEDKDTIMPGVTTSFKAEITLGGVKVPDSMQKVSWRSANISYRNSVTQDGELWIDVNQTPREIQMIATSEFFGTKGVKTMTVAPRDLSSISLMSANTANTITVDGVEWYVIKKDETDPAHKKALIWSKDMMETVNFGNAVWENSAVRAYLKNKCLTKWPTLSAAACETDITTRVDSAAGTDGSNFKTTKDKIFLLSEADLYGTIIEEPTSDPRDYTCSDMTKVSPSLVKCDDSMHDLYWLRTSDSTSVVKAVKAKSGALSACSIGYPSGLRPAMWVTYE